MLRPYQLKAVESVFREWEKAASTLVVMATGLGKTVVFSEIVRRMAPKRSIVIAHRGELLEQAAKHVSLCGLDVQIEKAERKASTDMFQRSPVVVASVQSLISGGEKKRMEKFNPNDFGLLVCDESHHATADSYTAILKHFKQNPDLKIFGCTATPDRSDEEALGKVFETVAFQYDIAEAIRDGWLVPIEQQIITVKSLDYSKVRTTAGDLNGADLAKVMIDEKPLQGICSATIENIGNRKTIVFASSVKHASLCSDIFNRHRAGMAMWVCGETHPNERAMLLKDFAEGRVQVFVNVGIGTEGFDVPGIECVVMGRPTKSRSLYCQMAGRSTRPLPGILDDQNSAFERREAIAASSKPVATIIDFCGNSGRHKLITCLDILGGKFSDETKEKARKKAEESGEAARVDQLLEESEEEIRKRIEEARQREAARRARLIAKADYHSRVVNPFDEFDRTPSAPSTPKEVPDFSEKQRTLLMKLGIKVHEITYQQGQAIINQYIQRLDKGFATAGQVNCLKGFGYDTKGMTKEKASQLIEELKQNGWKRPLLQSA